ncbi:hypothetical protein ACLMJK_006321 [Lecanora helva]
MKTSASLLILLAFAFTATTLPTFNTADSPPETTTSPKYENDNPSPQNVKRWPHSFSPKPVPDFVSSMHGWLPTPCPYSPHVRRPGEMPNSGHYRRDRTPHPCNHVNFPGPVTIRKSLPEKWVNPQATRKESRTLIDRRDAVQGSRQPWIILDIPTTFATSTSSPPPLLPPIATPTSSSTSLAPLLPPIRTLTSSASESTSSTSLAPLLPPVSTSPTPTLSSPDTTTLTTATAPYVWNEPPCHGGGWDCLPPETPRVWNEPLCQWGGWDCLPPRMSPSPVDSIRSDNSATSTTAIETEPGISTVWINPWPVVRTITELGISTVVVATSTAVRTIRYPVASTVTIHPVTIHQKREEFPCPQGHNCKPPFVDEAYPAPVTPTHLKREEFPKGPCPPGVKDCVLNSREQDYPATVTSTPRKRGFVKNFCLILWLCKRESTDQGYPASVIPTTTPTITPSASPLLPPVISRPDPTSSRTKHTPSPLLPPVVSYPHLSHTPVTSTKTTEEGVTATTVTEGVVATSVTTTEPSVATSTTTTPGVATTSAGVTTTTITDATVTTTTTEAVPAPSFTTKILYYTDRFVDPPPGYRPPSRHTVPPPSYPTTTTTTITTTPAYYTDRFIDPPPGYDIHGHHTSDAPVATTTTEVVLAISTTVTMTEPSDRIVIDPPVGWRPPRRPTMV